MNIDILFKNGNYIFCGEIFKKNKKSIYFYNMFGDEYRLEYSTKKVYKNKKYFSDMKKFELY